MISDCPACEVADDLLTRTGDAMQNKDFDAFMNCFTLPFVIETFESKRLLQTRREMRGVFEGVRQFRRANGVVEIVRENVAAEFVDSETIAATHVSRMLQKGDILFGRPYPAYSIVRRLDGVWRIQFCQYAVDDPVQLNDVLTRQNEETPRHGAAFP